MSPVLLHPDPFSAVLLNSPALPVTQEQKNLIREILETGASDSRFAQKMYQAIELVLTGGNAVIPTLTSLVPPNAVIGSASFDLHVHGTNFTPESVIIFAGVEEPTTFISATEVTTGINMPLWTGPAVVQVQVLNANGVVSDSKDFSFDAVMLQTAKTEQKVLSTQQPPIRR